MTDIVTRLLAAVHAARTRPFPVIQPGLAGEAADEIERLRDALAGVLRRYVGLVESGDAGNWDCETEPEVIAARAALAGTTDQPSVCPRCGSDDLGDCPYAVKCTSFPTPAASG